MTALPIFKFKANGKRLCFGRDMTTDFQSLVDKCLMPCAVISVERTADGRCGDVRIVCGNKKYKDDMGPAFHDNMLYHELVPQEPTFEDFCFRSAIMGQRAHGYLWTEAHRAWTDLTLLPLVHESDNLGYCLFMVEVTEGQDAERMAGVSADTAAAAVKASVALAGTDDLHEGAKVVLDEILELTGGFSTRITLVDHENKEAENFCEAFAKDLPADEELSRAEITYETVCSWQEMLGYTTEIIAEDERDMAEIVRANPEWGAALRAYSVHSLILMPLRQGRITIGYLYVTNFNTDKMIEIKEMLELISFLLSSQIANYLLLRELERMSNVDGLTGLLNRRAMLRRMRAVSEAEERMPFGVINIDLNGLKFVNDNEGHDAGDMMLIQAAEVLRKIFRDEDLFRTGGDEFIVIATDIEHTVFERKVERLRADSAKNVHVNFAIGAFWSDGTTDIRTAFAQADELMYADKNAFYEQHPELDRR